MNDIFNVMNAAISDKHFAIIKIVKKLDFDLMIKAIPQKFCESTTLNGSCIDILSKQITLDNCIKLLLFSDTHIIDELKINCLKFITLNLVSFFSEGSKLQEQLIGLPIYLIKDIENFVKEKNVNKFLWLDMTYFEKEINYT